MGIAEKLTPPRTEEIKPGLFIQRTNSGKYRQIFPIAWNGKIHWKEQLSSVFSFRFVFTIGVILLLVWAYNQDNAALREFYDSVVSDPTRFCLQWEESQRREPCTPEQHTTGKCWMNGSEISEVKLNVTWID